MTAAEAIRIATKQVRIHHFGSGQYQVDHWSTEHNAWWTGNMTTRKSALQLAHERRIERALIAYGFDPLDACAVANSATYNFYPKDWRQCLRDELKAALAEGTKE